MLERIADSDYAELALVVVPPTTKTRPGLAELEPRPHSTTALRTAIDSSLLAIYRALEAKVVSERDAFALVNGNSVLHRIPKIEATTPTPESSPGQALTLSLRGILPPREGQDGGGPIDVFIQLGAPELAAHAAAAARYGVWSLKHARCEPGDAAAAGFWPVCQEWPVIESQILVWNPITQHTTILTRSFTGINRFAVKLNRSALYWKTSSLLPRELQKLKRLGADQYFSRAKKTDETLAILQSNEDAKMSKAGPLGPPTTGALGIHISRNVRRRAQDFVSRHFQLEPWILLFHLGEELFTSVHQFRKLLPPTDRYWADPHVVRKNGRFYVFVEEFLFSTGKGHIAVLVIDSDGGYEGPTTILQRDYHLSYPCVFEHAGTFYMIPESSANRSVDLYRCVEFPSKWEFACTLLNNIAAVDATVLRHGGKWWLFTNVIENEGASYCEELFLFHCDVLIGGKWTSHVANPIVSDVRKSRPAGAIFCRNSELYRPAQDCSMRYGYAMTINRITSLLEDDYAETAVARIEPTWDENIVATHTLAYTPGITVIDALQPRWRI